MDPNDLDLSATTTELFPELATPSQQHQGVRLDSVAENQTQAVRDFADPQPVTSQELNFKALRDEVSKAIQEREYWRGKAEQTQLAKPQEPPKHDPLSDIDSDDWAKGKAVKEAVMDLREENRKLRAEMADQLAAMNTRSQFSDWKEMVTKHVPELTSTNPIFAEMIDRSSNPYEAAYLLARLNAGNQQPPPQQQQMNPNAQRALANAQKPGSPSTVGGQATLSAADYYASMSDDDFMKMAMKNMAGI
jgi:hypothetical protein